jgi:uncharacterized protein YkwD
MSLKSFIQSKQFVFTPIAISLILVVMIFSGISFAAEPEYSSWEVIKAVNEERTVYNLPTLDVDVRLQEAAQNKANHLLDKDYFDHFSPAGVTPWDFILSVGFDYRLAGENLALNYTDPDEVTQAWMASGSHRRNILNSHFDKVGVGVAEGEIKGKSAIVTVLMLGKERADNLSIFNLSVIEIVKDILRIR